MRTWITTFRTTEADIEWVVKEMNCLFFKHSAGSEPARSSANHSGVGGQIGL